VPSQGRSSTEVAAHILRVMSPSSSAQPRATPSIRRVLIAAEIGCAAALLTAVLDLPWARYEIRGGTAGHALNASGALAIALVVVLGTAVMVAAARLLWRATVLCFAEIALSVAALVITVLTAMARVADANSRTFSWGGSTSFALGSKLALVASAALLCSAIAGLVLDLNRRTAEITAEQDRSAAPAVVPHRG